MERIRAALLCRWPLELRGPPTALWARTPLGPRLLCAGMRPELREWAARAGAMVPELEG